MEDTASFGPNVVSFLIKLGSRLWYVVGSYVPPNDVPAVHSVDQALRAATKGLEMILMGDLNACLGYPREKREEDLATALVDRGMVNMSEHFITGRCYKGADSWT